MVGPVVENPPYAGERRFDLLIWELRFHMPWGK